MSDEKNIVEEVLTRSHANLFSYSSLAAQLAVQEQLNRSAKRQENLAYAINKVHHPELQDIEDDGMPGIVNFGVIAGSDEIKELMKPKDDQHPPVPPPIPPPQSQSTPLSKMLLAVLAVLAIAGIILLAILALSGDDDDAKPYPVYDIVAEPYQPEPPITQPTP